MSACHAVSETSDPDARLDDHAREIPAERKRRLANETARRAALARIPDTTRIVSICTGAFILAAAGLSDARTWALTNIAESFGVKELAAVAGQSVRSFTRHFTAEAGVSPGPVAQKALS